MNSSNSRQKKSDFSREIAKPRNRPPLSDGCAYADSATRRHPHGSHSPRPLLHNPVRRARIPAAFDAELRCRPIPNTTTMPCASCNLLVGGLDAAAAHFGFDRQLKLALQRQRKGDRRPRSAGGPGSRTHPTRVARLAETRPVGSNALRPSWPAPRSPSEPAAREESQERRRLTENDSARGGPSAKAEAQLHQAFLRSRPKCGRASSSRVRLRGPRAGFIRPCGQDAPRVRRHAERVFYPPSFLRWWRADRGLGSRSATPFGRQRFSLRLGPIVPGAEKKRGKSDRSA